MQSLVSSEETVRIRFNTKRDNENPSPQAVADLLVGPRTRVEVGREIRRYCVARVKAGINGSDPFGARLYVIVRHEALDTEPVAKCMTERCNLGLKATCVANEQPESPFGPVTLSGVRWRLLRK